MKNNFKGICQGCLCNDGIHGSNSCDFSLCISSLTLRETETFFSFKLSICNPEILRALLRAT